MIAAVVAELELVGFAAEGEADELMAEADAEDGRAAGEAADVVLGIRDGLGSPGPLERKTPSGLRARTSSAEVCAGTTVTRQPSWASMRRMFFLMP